MSFWRQIPTESRGNFGGCVDNPQDGNTPQGRDANDSSRKHRHKIHQRMEGKFIEEGKFF